MPRERPTDVAGWLALPTAEFCQELDRARLEGDGGTTGVNADELMAGVLSGGLATTKGEAEVRYGRLGYNLLLDVADRLIAAPELALNPDSQVSRFLADIPKEARNYLDPIPAPDWVDTAQLEVAEQLWEECIIPLLLVLYSSSLPGCYLIKHGIPALYDTGKLAKAKYIGQRLYETALMLDAVMSRGGVAVVQDTEDPPHEVLKGVLDKLVPGAWAQHGRGVKIDPEHQATQGYSPGQFYEKFAEEYERERGNRPPARYLWGPGFLSARKVRALHSSMRYMLQHGCPHGAAVSPEGKGGQPERFVDELRKRGISWDAEKLGCPINQEDQAFTLLTFGYLLPRGLEHWGCKLSDEQKNAFLHLWKVVGYVMGVRTDLTTDRWDEAEALYDLLVRRQAGGGEAGRVLTETVMDFTSQYLPKSFGLASWLPGKMIIDQLSIDQERLDRAPPGQEPDPGQLDLAGAILRPEVIERCQQPGARALYWVLRRIVEIYFFVRNDWLLKIPGVGGLVRKMFHEPGRELYESFKGEYCRKPFFIPRDATDWELEPGVTPEFSEKVQTWRRKLFLRIGVGLVCLTSSTLVALVFFGAVVTNLASLLSPSVRSVLGKEINDVVRRVDLALSTELVSWLVLSGLVTLLLFAGGVWILKVSVPRYFAKRPRLQSPDPVPRRK